MSAVATIPAPSAYARGGGVLTGTGGLLRLILRRDRWLLAVWTAVSAALPVTVGAATTRTYATPAIARTFAASVAVNPGELATRGPVYAPTVGGLTAWGAGSSYCLMAGLVALLFAVRQLRQEEQSGRRELTGATAVGRHAPLAATLLAVACTAVAAWVLAAVGLVAVGYPVAGSVALPGAAAAAALTFAAVGTVTSQLAAGSGTARGIGLVVLAVAFALRAAGDATGNGLAWASPLGWVRLVRPYAGERWWVLALFVPLVAVLVLVAGSLSGHRDLGDGLIPVRPGRATARSYLRSPMALAWRRSRGTLIAWTVAFGVFGLFVGAVGRSSAGQLGGAAFKPLLGDADPGLGLVRIVLYVFAQVAAGFAVFAVLRVRGDETSGLAEPVVTTPAGRSRWVLSHVVVTVAGTLLVFAALGLGAYAGLGGHPVVVAESLAYAPAALLVGGFALALAGLAPRAAAPVAWAALGVLVLLDLLAEFRLLDPALFAASPFQLSGHPAVLGLTAMTVLALALGGAGVAAMARRDLTAA